MAHQIRVCLLPDDSSRGADVVAGFTIQGGGSLPESLQGAAVCQLNAGNHRDPQGYPNNANTG